MATSVATLHFSGRARTAAYRLLDHTSLQGVTLGLATDDGSCLTVAVPEDRLLSLSTGERHLWQFLSSLSGAGAVNLWSTMHAVDEASAHVAWSALGDLIGVDR